MRGLVFACFFLSGASGLIFELCWTRGLTLVFGSTTLAISTVLSTFMGGLGLGSFLAGRYAHRVRDPIRAYALAEIAIGVFALLIPLVLGLYPGLNRWLWGTVGDRYTLLSILRFAAAALLLLGPTTLMGATLPLLARAIVSRPAELPGIGRHLGRLYATNLFGAVAGSFLAGFIFLPAFGVSTTNAIAASFNFALAAAILALGRVVSRRPAPVAPPLDSIAEPVASPPLSLPASAQAIVLTGFLLSGASAMTLQVLWTRALAVVIGSSVFSFTLILVGFLIGLGLGAHLFGRLADRLRRPVAALATLHLGIATAVGLSHLVMDRLPYFFAWLLGATRASVDTIQACQFAAVCASILPATVLMGGIFPLTIRAVTRDLDRVARDVGNAYALNTIGAIAGSFASGFVVLPLVGLERGIAGAALVSLALAVLMFGFAPALERRRRFAGIAVAATLAVAGLALPRWNLVDLSVGFFRVSIAKDYLERKRDKKSWEKPELLFYEDGIATTVSVDRWGKTVAMKNNGKVDASSDADMPTQIMVGLLPLLLYPHDVASRPPRVALIGYGSGVTAGSMTQFPIRSLEVVELEPAVYRAAHFFDHVNHRPTEDPRVTARVGDGRNFLSQRTDPFDVIVSQPSNPWISGVSNLFTREYFRAVKARLAPGGVFCQWAQLYEMAPWNVKSIYRTLLQEFPHVLVFAAEDLSSDTILIASETPIPIDIDRLAERLRDPRTRREAERAGLGEVHDVPASLLLGGDEIEAFTAGAELNTDDNARIEFNAPRDLLGYARYDSYLVRIYGPHWPYGRLSEIVRGYQPRPEGSIAAEEIASRRGRLARSLLRHGKAREAQLWSRRAREVSGGTIGADSARASLLLDLVATLPLRDPEIPLAPAGDLVPPIPPADTPPELGARLAREYAEVEALVAARKYASAYKVIEAWPDDLFGRLGPDFALMSGFLHYKAGFFGDAIDELRPLAEDATVAARRPALLYYLGRSHFSNANYRKAIEALERYIDLQSRAGQPLLPQK